MGHQEFKQLLFRLPFFKRGPIRAENEKVRGMQRLGRATRRPLVMEFQLMRLIKKLQHLGIVLHGVNGPQFHRMAFKLDRDAYFPTGKRATHIEETALDPARRRRSTKMSKEVTRGGWKLKPITPLLKRGGFHALLLLIALTLLLKAYPILEPKTR